MEKFRVEVDRNIYQGFGACVELCSKSFYLSEEDGKSKLKDRDEITTDGGNVKDTIEVNRLRCYGQAEVTCPFNAISITGYR